MHLDTLPYLLAFTIVLAVSASYYVASKWLSPSYRRSGDAVRPYACGEEAEGVSVAEPPYPVAVLVFAAVEAVPLAVLVASSDWHGFLLLLVASVAAPYAVLWGGRGGRG